jgi:hypothetical protein
MHPTDTPDMPVTGPTTTMRFSTLDQLAAEPPQEFHPCSSHQSSPEENATREDMDHKTDGPTTAQELSGSGLMPTNTSPDKTTTTVSGDLNSTVLSESTGTTCATPTDGDGATLDSTCRALC